MMVAQPRLFTYGCRDTAQQVVAALQASPLLFRAAKARKLIARYPALMTMRNGAGTDYSRVIRSNLILSHPALSNLDHAQRRRYLQYSRKLRGRIHPREIIE